MKFLALTALVLVASTAARAEWEKPSIKETSLIILANTALFMDMMTSIDGNRKGRSELNPLIYSRRRSFLLGPPGPQPPITPEPYIPMQGNYPSTERIMLWFGLCVVGNTALWYVLPHPWRSAWAGTVIVVEGVTVVRQFSIGLKMTL